jgi:hypothetical protein
MRTKKTSKTSKKTLNKRQTQIKLNSMSKSDLSQKGYVNSPFLKYSRLPRLDRKYCSCLMAVRYKQQDNPNANPYAICTYNVYIKRGKFKKNTLDCGINYDFDNYHIGHLKAYAKEKGIPLHRIDNNGNSVELSKTSIIRKLRDDMIKAKKEKSKSKQ